MFKFKERNYKIMKKAFLSGLIIASFFLLMQSASASVYLNDAFTRSVPYPWDIACSSGGGIGACPSGEASVTIVSNQLDISVTAGGGMGVAHYPTDLSVENFTYEFDYIHRAGNFFVAEWDYNPTLNYTSVRFDTSSNVIYITDTDFLTDYITQAYPFDNFALVGVPYSLSGWGAGSTHHIKLAKTGITLTILIDGTQAYELTDSRFDVNWNGNLLANYRSAGTDYARFDNAVITGVPTKIIPNILIYFLPNATVGVGQETQVICTSDTTGLTLHLYYGASPNEVANPYTFTPSVAGNLYFECCNDATDIYEHNCNGNVLSVGTVTTTPTPYGSFDWYSPIPSVNQTAWQMGGYGWVLPFFTPFFIATVILAIISALAARVGGMTVGGIVALALIFGYSVLGIYPMWVGIILVVLGGFVIAKFGKEITVG
jgi:hypothetical protein